MVCRFKREGESERGLKAPSPGSLRDPTSPRRGEVEALGVVMAEVLNALSSLPDQSHRQYWSGLVRADRPEPSARKNPAPR